MSDPKKRQKPVEIEELEIQKETLQDLTPAQAEGAGGGLVRRSALCNITTPEDGCLPTSLVCV